VLAHGTTQWVKLRRGLSLASVLVTLACGPAAPPPRPASPSTAAGRETLPEPLPTSDDDDPQFSTRGWLGVEIAAPEPTEPGVLVRSVIRGSPAERAGILAGDHLLKLDGVSVVAPDDVVRLVGARAPGTRLGVVVQRDGAERLFAVELEPAPDETGALRRVYVGARAPALFGLETVQGSLEPTSAGLRGKIVVLEFWAPWCAVCRFLVPTMNDWHARYAAQGVALLGITMDPVSTASPAAMQLDMRYPVASDHSGKTTVAYRANALPTLFVIDRRGIVRDVVVGYSSKRIQEMQALIERLLDAP